MRSVLCSSLRNCHLLRARAFASEDKELAGIGEIKRIENQITNYSGYCCYDEQYIKIDGERAYRLAVFDQVLNVPVSEEIAANIEYNTIYGFLKEVFMDKLLFAVTTDHRREYKEIMDELGPSISYAYSLSPN